MNYEILRGLPEHASILTDITIKAKRHWGYPENWIQQWIPLMTISEKYIVENEVWLVVVDHKPVAYYSLKLHPVIARRQDAATTLAPHASAGEQSLSMAGGLLRREEHPPRNDRNDLWLDNLWVLPEHMGQGIGKQLCYHAFERSRMRGISILKIEADPNAQSFYEKMGAHKVGEHQSEVDGQLRILPVMEINL